jgi:hypothetical protein
VLGDTSAASTLVRPFGGFNWALSPPRPFSLVFGWMFSQVFTWDVLEGLVVQVVCYFEGGWS